MCGALDPATGQTKARPGRLGDFSSLVSGFSQEVGRGAEMKRRLFVHHDWTKRAAPTKFIRSIFEHHAEFGYEKFAVETNLYRNLLLPNIHAERRRIEKELKKEIRIPFYDIENTENKEKRIYTLEPKVTHGWILFNRALSQEAMMQLAVFPLGDHDDFCDTLEMLWNLVNNRYKPSALSIDAQGGR
jgi:predicted phage terminase large subunit-like protein